LFHLTWWPRGAVGYSALGHHRIAVVADTLLTGSASRRIESKLKGTLLDHHDWERTMLKKYPSIEPLHFHHQVPEWTCNLMLQQDSVVRCNNTVAEEGSLVCALSYFYDRYSHDPLVLAYPRSKLAADMPTLIKVLSPISETDQTSFNELRWMIMLIGDMHQPLHILREYNYGKDVKVVYKDKEYTLYSFFEEELPKHLPQQIDEKRARSGFDKMKKQFVRSRAFELFSRWSRETGLGLCGQVYARLAGIETARIRDNEGLAKELASKWKNDAPFVITDELFEHFKKTVDDLTLIAGARVAAVLHDVLLHEDHRHAENHGQGKFHRMAIRTPDAMLVNFLIGGPVAGVLVFLFLWHESGCNLNFLRGNKVGKHEKS